MRAACVLLLGATLTACVSADQCATAIPAQLRADTLLYVLDRQMVSASAMPRDHQTLGLGAGRPFGTLSDADQREVARRATGYAACIKDRVDRDN